MKTLGIGLLFIFHGHTIYLGSALVHMKFPGLTTGKAANAPSVHASEIIALTNCGTNTRFLLQLYGTFASCFRPTQCTHAHLKMNLKYAYTLDKVVVFEPEIPFFFVFFSATCYLMWVGYTGVNIKQHRDCLSKNSTV